MKDAPSHARAGGHLLARTEEVIECAEKLPAAGALLRLRTAENGTTLKSSALQRFLPVTQALTPCAGGRWYACSCEGLRMPAVLTAATRSVGRRRQTYNARSRGWQNTCGAADSMAI